MLCVTRATGPATARVGDDVIYRVASFNEASPAASASKRVRWLIKAADGGVLAHFLKVGPELRLRVPDTWNGLTASVMPYLNSPTGNVSVTTTVAAAGAPAPAPRVRRFKVVREDARFYASADGEPRFYLGTEVSYGARRGLMNSANPPGPRYQPQEFERAHRDWAWYLHPTITCESRGHFSCLNTYDRAAFTFGHIQLAAHTPNDNFVLFFREALQAAAAAEYFPDLKVVDGLIHVVRNGRPSPLESATDTTGLMDYFNPTAEEVDDVEADRAARVVDWCLRHPAMRELQVAFAVREQQKKLRTHARRLPLDGVIDKLCLVVLDILHQGRAKYPAIAEALAAPDPFDALLSLGASRYRERVATLRAGIRELEAVGRVGHKVFNRDAGGFIEPHGA